MTVNSHNHYYCAKYFNQSEICRLQHKHQPILIFQHFKNCKKYFSALRPKSTNILTAARIEVGSFWHPTWKNWIQSGSNLDPVAGSRLDPVTGCELDPNWIQ